MWLSSTWLELSSPAELWEEDSWKTNNSSRSVNVDCSSTRDLHTQGGVRLLKIITCHMIKLTVFNFGPSTSLSRGHSQRAAVASVVI